MTEADMTGMPRPAVPYLKYSPQGEPYLEGHKCGSCGEVYLGERTTCSRCFARGEIKPVRLANRGKLYNYTIVYRNFPGVKVPFVSAVVDLEGGGTLKGNLVDIAPAPENLEFDMPVEIVYRDAGRTDSEGNKYLAYFFVPATRN